MFFQAGGNGQYVWIEDNIVRREVRAFCQHIVSARTDVDFSLEIVGLALLIERHHNGGRAISPDQSRVPDEFLFAVFQADGVHHCFSLNAFEPRFDDAPL